MMISRRMQQLLFSFLLLVFLMPASAVRYMGDPKDAPAIQNLIAILQVQGQEIEKILHMLTALQNEKSGLDERKETLGKAMQVLKNDQVLLNDGKLSKEAYDERWLHKGYEKKLTKDMQLFKDDVKRFNRSIKTFNRTVEKMKHVLKKRSPGQIKALTEAIKNLVRKLQQALDDGNYERARYIARKSDVAREFGYKEN